MSSTCSKIQDVLADRGPEALRDDAAALAHVESCADCSEVLEGLAMLHEVLEELPRIDAPDATVEALRVRPELLVVADDPPSTNWRERSRRWLAEQVGSGGLAVRPAFGIAAMLLVTVISWRLFTGPGVGTESAPMDFYFEKQVASPVVDDADQVTADELPEELLSELHALGYLGDGPAEGDAEAGAERQEARRERGQEPPKPKAKRLAEQRFDDGAERPPLPVSEASPPEPQDQTYRGGSPVVEEEILVTAEAPVYEVTSATMGSSVSEAEIAVQDAFDEVFGNGNELGLDDGATDTPRRVQSKDTAVGGRVASGAVKEEAEGTFEASLQADDGLFDQRLRSNAPADARKADEANKVLEKKARDDDALVEVPLSDPEAARILLQQRRRTEGLEFREATGYWRNTYLPGDPEMRQLAAELEDMAATSSGQDDSSRPSPHDLAQHPRQPFDHPENAALAVYLNADRKAIDGRQRMLVQVGLQGTERHSGRRGAMNVAVVLDLTEPLTAEGVQTVGALLNSLAKSRELGDRFRLFIAGHGGGEVVAPEDFRHGPLTLALRRALDSMAAEDEPWVDQRTVYSQALAAAAGTDDPEAPLGSSLVLLVAAEIDDPNRQMQLAHRAAVGGVITSVVALGDDPLLEELDELALAGQGHRRLLQRPQDAAGVVDGELAAIGRVIARAVRLRIRLSPGVHLVDVLGSERLDDAAADRVRQAEESIDRRLSDNLGIRSDRGDDEAGLQIVIPTFYAGDSHVVLLDVVADGSGPIADVRVRYKDLVYLENGVSRARLDVPRGLSGVPGPLERNVLENFMAGELRIALRAAAAQVSLGEPLLAAERLGRHEALLRGLGEHIAGWLGDGDVQRDLRLLAAYREQLTGTLSDEDRDYLRASLNFSAYLEQLPRPPRVVP